MFKDPRFIYSILSRIGRETSIGIRCGFPPEIPNGIPPGINCVIYVRTSRIFLQEISLRISPRIAHQTTKGFFS